MEKTAVWRCPSTGSGTGIIKYRKSRDNVFGILLCAVPVVNKLPLKCSAEKKQFIDYRYMGKRWQLPFDEQVLKGLERQRYGGRCKNACALARRALAKRWPKHFLCRPEYCCARCWSAYPATTLSAEKSRICTGGTWGFWDRTFQLGPFDWENDLPSYNCPGGWVAMALKGYARCKESI